MDELIFVLFDFGKDKWKMVLNLVVCFLGIKLMGDIWKLGSGGLGKGFVICFKVIFLERFLVIMLGWEIVEGRFLENLEICFLVKLMFVLYLRLLYNWEINF